MDTTACATFGVESRFYHLNVLAVSLVTSAVLSRGEDEYKEAPPTGAVQI